MPLDYPCGPPAPGGQQTAGSMGMGTATCTNSTNTKAAKQQRNKQQELWLMWLPGAPLICQKGHRALLPTPSPTCQDIGVQSQFHQCGHP